MKEFWVVKQNVAIFHRDSSAIDRNYSGTERQIDRGNQVYVIVFLDYMT